MTRSVYPGVWRARGVPIQGLAWFASVWVLLFCVWGFANGPALTTAWWYHWLAQCRRVVMTCGGYALGGVISSAVAHFRTDPRIRLATDVPGKLRYLWKLNALFLGSPRYHMPWLSVLHVGLLSLMLLAVAAAALSRRASWSPRRAGISALMTATAFVTPYLGVLLVVENWPSQRVMYLAPLLITAAWNELDVALAALRANVAVALCPLLLITLAYASIARVNSAEYVTLFQCDLEVLRRIESSAAHERVTTVFVAPPPDNVYGLAYGAKLSAFYKDWAARYFIPAFSSLQSTYEKPESAACLARCSDVDFKSSRSLRFYAVQDGALGCVCWGTERMPAARLLAR